MTFGALSVDLILLILAGITIFLCVKRGLFLTVLKFCKLFLSFGAAYLWGNAFGNFLSDKFIYKPVRASIFDKINGVYLDATSGFDVESTMNSIPQFLLNDEMRAKLNGLEGTGEELVNSITDTVAGALSSVICAILGFLIVFVLAFIVLSIVYIFVKSFRKKIKIIGAVDGILGGVFGLLWICVLYAVLASALKFFSAESGLYAESAILKFFGDSAFFENIKFLNVSEWLAKLQNIGK